MKAIHIISAFITIVWLASAGTGRASGEGSVGARIAGVEIEAAEAGYRFSVKMDKEDALELIEVDWADKKFSFNKKDFGQIDQVYVKGFWMVAPTTYSKGKQDTVILVLPYNVEPVESDTDNTTRYQYDVVRLHFINGELKLWQKATAIKDREGQWQLSSKEFVISNVVDGVDKVDANGVHDDGEESGQDNPYSDGYKVYEDGL